MAFWSYRYVALAGYDRSSGDLPVGVRAFRGAEPRQLRSTHQNLDRVFFTSRTGPTSLISQAPPRPTRAVGKSLSYDGGEHPMPGADGDVIIAGSGIGGLTAALALHEKGVACRVIEAVGTFKPLGVGINVLPHASQVLGRLGLEAALSERAVITSAAAFYNRFGQLVFRDAAGRDAGYSDPQYSIHRGELHAVLQDAVIDRLGRDRVLMGHRLIRFEESNDGVRCVADTAAGEVTIAGRALVGADGIHSAVRRQLFPDEVPYRYSGVMMWRGSTPWPSVLDGRTMIRAGWLATGKMVVYPIGPVDPSTGHQLLNWAAEIEMPQRTSNDWNLPGRKEDFAGYFADWRFDWLDFPALIEASEPVLEYPMVDRDPLPRWTHGRVTLLGDAAHPMVPRGSNGAGQAILDADALARLLAETTDLEGALTRYDEERRTKTTQVVLANRSTPPDVVLREVYERTGDQPFDNIDDVISRDELVAIQDSYRSIAGFSAARPSAT